MIKKVFGALFLTFALGSFIYVVYQAFAPLPEERYYRDFGPFIFVGIVALIALFAGYQMITQRD